MSGRASGPVEFPALGAMELGVPLPEALQQVLEKAIVSGAYEPGSKINVGRVAHELGVSPIPVREALRTLAERGWVLLKPRFGAYVRERSWAEAEDLHETRQILESEIAALAAQRRSLESLTLMRQFVEAGNVAVSQGDTAAFAQINASFHKALASAAGNRVLAQLHDQLTLRIQFYFASAVSQRFVESALEHGRIYSAIEARDCEQAASLARSHANATRATLQATLSKNEGSDH